MPLTERDRSIARAAADVAAEEIKALRADNARLRKENVELREQLGGIDEFIDELQTGLKGLGES